MTAQVYTVHCGGCGARYIARGQRPTRCDGCGLRAHVPRTLATGLPAARPTGRNVLRIELMFTGSSRPEAW